MSTNNGGWKPSARKELTCPESGQKVWVKRPDQTFWIKAGRTAHTFSRFLTQDTDSEEDRNLTPEKRGLKWLASASDDELGSYVLFAKHLVVAMCDGPKLVLEPREGHDEMGPDDLPSGDFWFLFNYGMTNFMGIKVPVGDPVPVAVEQPKADDPTQHEGYMYNGEAVQQEVEVSDLNTFRDESGVSGDRLDGLHVPEDAERVVGDQGLVGSAGV